MQPKKGRDVVKFARLRLLQRHDAWQDGQEVHLLQHMGAQANLIHRQGDISIHSLLREHLVHKALLAGEADRKMVGREEVLASQGSAWLRPMNPAAPAGRSDAQHFV